MFCGSSERCQQHGGRGRFLLALLVSTFPGILGHSYLKGSLRGAGDVRLLLHQCGSAAASTLNPVPKLYFDDVEACFSLSPPLSTGHKGKFGHEFLEFEFLSEGRMRYANNSNYKNDTMIRKEGR